MKLDRQSRPRRLRGVDVLAKTPEMSTESEVAQILRERFEGFYLDRSDPEQFQTNLADVQILEQAAGGPLIKEGLMQEFLAFASTHFPTLDSKQVTNVIGGHFSTVNLGAWIQLFPAEADFVYLEDGDLKRAVRHLKTEGPNVVSKERVLLNLMQIRPDQQAELRDVIESNVEQEWKSRGELVKNWNWLNTMLSRVASWELTHPESKERFELTPEEKKTILHFMRTMSAGANFEKFLRNACIVLAEEVELQSNGQIRIQMKKSQFGTRSELPERPQV